ncbi:MAG TPA: hypothetical protein VFO77_04855 [Actinoplanes sp.]|nr:hypothetical protein [Actinoplanes sp.]
MTAPQQWCVVALLAGAAVVVGWPKGVFRRRWTRRESAAPSWRPLVAAVPAAVARRPRRTMAATGVLTGLCGWVVAGPVGAGALGTYAALGSRAVLRRRVNRQRAALRARTLDAVGALAADLRAGLPAAATPAAYALTGSALAGSALAGSALAGSALAGSALAGSALAGSALADGVPAGVGSLGLVSAGRAVSSEVHRLCELTAAGWRLAERTGAPVADLIDRIEADARAVDRARAATAAQAAGARATALLLAGLPAGGIALGYGIGADPLAVLLHTPLGAACATGAVLLQLGGLAWAERLTGAGALR